MVPRRINMKLGVIGTGYVGLTTAVCLATIGHKMIVYDIDSEKLNKIKSINPPFFESRLKELLKKAINSKKLEVSSSIDDVIDKTEGCFVCVGTPTKGKREIDLSQVIQAIKNVSKSIEKLQKKEYHIITRSTIVPNTTKKHLIPIVNKISKKSKIHLITIPEFLREGNAIDDFMNPDKIVIGCSDKSSEKFAKKIFHYFNGKARFVVTNTQTSEMIKYANNAFFSTLISFSNEIANISEKISGIDSFEVMNALIEDKRITTKIKNDKIVPNLVTYLFPGCGFGGSCFPKDVKAISQFAEASGVNSPLLDAVISINDERPKKIISLSESILGNLKNMKISVLGLTFKPNTDDVRSSPAIEAIKILNKKEAKISAYDPKIKSGFMKEIKNLSVCTNIKDCLENSNLVILFTNWSEFKSINEKTLKKYMKNPKIIDGRGYLNSKNFSKNTYYKIGFLK